MLTTQLRMAPAVWAPAVADRRQDERAEVDTVDRGPATGCSAWASGPFLRSNVSATTPSGPTETARAAAWSARSRQ